jgi:hypothetical protein
MMGKRKGSSAPPEFFVNSRFKQRNFQGLLGTGKCLVLAEFRVGNKLLVMRF